MATNLTCSYTGHVSLFGPLNIFCCFHPFRNVTTCLNSGQKKHVFKTTLRSIFDGISLHSQQIGKAFIILALYQQNQNRILHLYRQQLIQKISLEIESYISYSIDMEKKTDDGIVKGNKQLEQLIGTQSHVFKNAQKKPKII